MNHHFINGPSIVSIDLTLQQESVFLIFKFASFHCLSSVLECCYDTSHCFTGTNGSPSSTTPTAATWVTRVTPRTMDSDVVTALQSEEEHTLIGSLTWAFSDSQWSSAFGSKDTIASGSAQSSRSKDLGSNYQGATVLGDQ